VQLTNPTLPVRQGKANVAGMSSWPCVAVGHQTKQRRIHVIIIFLRGGGQFASSTVRKRLHTKKNLKRKNSAKQLVQIFCLGTLDSMLKT
jgi:hypothetical protein